MFEKKHWYTSKGIVGGIASTIIVLFTAIGVDALKGQEVELANVLLAVFGAIAGIVAIYGRAKAKQEIIGKKEKT